MRNHFGTAFRTTPVTTSRRRLVVETLESRYVLAANLASVAGLVYQDATADGVTPGEELADVLVELYRDDGDGSFQLDGRDTLRESAATDTAGRYRFDGLTAGTYFLRQPAQQAAFGPLAERVSPPLVVTPRAAQGSPGLTIDSFDITAQSVMASGSAGMANRDASAVAAAESLGGERDLFVELTSPSGRLELLANETSPGLLEFGSLGTTTGTRLVTWDGPDGDATQLDFTGLGAIDLTDGGTNVALQLAIGADHDDGIATLRVYTDASHWSQVALAMPNTGGGADAELVASFATDFVPMGARGGANFARVGAVQFELDGGQAIDGQFDQLTTLGPTVLLHDFANRRLADLSLTKTVDSTSPTIGQDVTFTIQLSNAGPDAATGVTVADQLPAAVRFVSASADQGDYDSATGVWAVGTVAAGDSHTLQIRATVVAAGTTTNAAEVLTADQFDTDSTPGNNVTGEDDRDTASLRSEAADLSLTKTVDQSAPQLGDDVTFTVTLRNDGPDTATGIVIAEALPAGLELVSATPDQGTYAAGTGRWTVASLGPDATVRLDLRATVTTTGTKTNLAEIVAADQFDTDSTPGNNALGEDDQDAARVTAQTIDLALTKSVDQPAPNVGDLVVFTVTLRNTGPDTATGVTVRDALPSGLIEVSAEADSGSYAAATGIWTVGSVPAGGTRTLDLTAAVIEPATQTNVAEVAAADQFDIDSTPGNHAGGEDDQASATVSPQVVDLALTKSVDELSPSLGDQVHFTIVVHNNGPDTATGVTVLDLLPAGLTFVSASADQGTYDAATGLWSVATLPVGAERTLDVVAILTAVSAVPNVAEVASVDQYDVDSTPDNKIPAEDDQDEVLLTPTGSLSGHVYLDADNDGGRGSGDEGIGGVVITLTGTDRHGNSVLRTQTTAADGSYGFDDLAPSDDVGYQLAAAQPTTLLDGRDTVGRLGGTAAADSTVDTLRAIVLAAGAEGTDYDFGEIRPAAISGFVYVDANNDGIKQPGEKGIDGVTIKLIGTDDRGQNVARTAETDDRGQYVFRNLRPSGNGFYRLEEDQPAGYQDGKDTPGVPLNLSLFSTEAVDEVFSQIALPPGIDGHDFNFGERLNAFTKRRFLASSR